MAMTMMTSFLITRTYHKSHSTVASQRVNVQFSLTILMLVNNTFIWHQFHPMNSIPCSEAFSENEFSYNSAYSCEVSVDIGDLVSKETVCCVGGKVKH